MAAPPQEAGQADLRLPAVTVGPQVDLLILDRTPQSLHQNVVAAALSAGPADPDPLSLQAGHEVGGGELTALIEVEDPWLTAISRASRQNSVSRLLQSSQLSTFLETRSRIATR